MQTYCYKLTDIAIIETFDHWRLTLKREAQDLINEAIAPDRPIDKLAIFKLKQGVVITTKRDMSAYKFINHFMLKDDCGGWVVKGRTKLGKQLNRIAKQMTSEGMLDKIEDMIATKYNVQDFGGCCIIPYRDGIFAKHEHDVFFKFHRSDDDTPPTLPAEFEIVDEQDVLALFDKGDK